MRKAAKRFRKTKHERSQPAHRRKLGMLEKHKDYVQRARDYNEKKEKVRELQEKAALKNPDEFYFHMEKTRKRYKELESRLKRKAVLGEMLTTVETQKKLMSNEPKQKVVN